ncbi:hypothetical protein KAW50_03835 [candidate division WOR-3 bacterium]|nr:hypothetical protein [candidate division WOR-3 bacterium]
MRFKISCVLLILPILASAVEFRAKKTIETEYGSWYNQYGIKEDSGTVVEDKISVGFSESHFRGGFEFLYTAKLNQEFGLKNTALALISWKDIGFESDKISATLGDFYYTLGQGLIIGMEPMEASGRDRRIQGIKIETKLPWFKMSEIWGVPWEIDRLQKNYNVLNDTSDVLFGFDVSTSLLSNYGISLSGRGLRVEMEDTLYTNLGGIDFEFRHNWISLYLEAAQRSGWMSRKLHPSRKKYKEKSGWGIYSSLDTYIGSYGFNLQFMNYDSLSVGGIGYRYNLLPTINQSGYQIDEGQKITCNGIGFQVTGEKTFGDLMLTLSHSDIGNKDTTEAKRILEYYLKAELMDFYGLLKFLSLDGVDTHFDKRREWTGEIYGSFKDIETTLSMQKVDVTAMAGDPIIPFMDIGLAIEFPIYEIFAMCLDYTRRSKEVIEDAPGTEWYGIGVKIEPSSKVFFEVWGGKEKGGLVCSGGVCRWVSPFDGFKVSLNMTL